MSLDVRLATVSLSDKVVGEVYVSVGMDIWQHFLLEDGGGGITHQFYDRVLFWKGY